MLQEYCAYLLLLQFKIYIPAVYYGLIPTPVLVIIAVVAGLTLNSSATNFMHAVNGAFSGTEML